MSEPSPFASIMKAALRGGVAGLVLGGAITLVVLTNEYVMTADEITVASYSSESTGFESSEIVGVETSEFESTTLAFNH